MDTTAILNLMRTRSEELKSRANAKINSIGVTDRKSETDNQREMRFSAQGDFNAADEIDGLITEIEQS